MKRKWRPLAQLTAALVLISAAAATTTGLRVATAAAVAAPEGDDPVSVIVTFDRATAPLLAAMDGHLARDVTRIGAGGSYSATVDRASVAALAAQPGVVDVAPNRRLRPLLTQSTEEIGAPSAWANGVTGSGRVIAVIDTGVDDDHPMLAGKVVAEACFTPAKPDGVGGYCKNDQTTQYGAGAASPCTGTLECGHGTHVASVAIGNGDGRRGVAPDARLIAVQVFTSAANPSEGVGTDEANVVRALEWVYSLRDSQPIAAVNLSLGGDPLVTPCAGSAALMSVIDRLDAAGIAAIVAAGNDGSTTRLSFPACLPDVISVGSVGDSGRVSSFSNSAPTLSLVAPGESIIAAWSGPCCYREASGTSFAAPHVAGAFAALRQQLPTWSLASLLALLDRTGDPAYAPATGGYLLAGKIRIDRATRPEFQSLSPAALPQASSPIGALDKLDTVPGGLHVLGWSLDADTVDPVTVHVYVDGVLLGAGVANTARPDVAAAYPGYGPAHGFDVTVPVPGGTHTVCVYSLDRGQGRGNVLLSCVVATTGQARGSLDVAAAAQGGVRVAGWALDADTATPIPVHVYVDDVLTAAIVAAKQRPDVAAAFPGFGSSHGFDNIIAVTGGSHTVCAYAIDIGSGGGVNPLLGCQVVSPPSGPPVGSLDVAAADLSGVRVAGWAADPDTNASIDVHVYVDGAGVAFLAAGDRPDVAAVLPSFGAAHGFNRHINTTSGPHRVCAYAINQGAGSNVLLACADVVVPSSSPFGTLDVVARANGSARVEGWAIDPDGAPSTTVHVYVDGALVASAVANVNRLDVAAAYPGTGTAHGYSVTVSLVAGSHEVCTYGINSGAGANALLGCLRT
ncbi:MAG TPA: S8 family serine peptidase [Acidimicrobiales bacterium]|nr:S8 family serine peptidase [Acidimicrobiales bacterium]